MARRLKTNTQPSPSRRRPQALPRLSQPRCQNRQFRLEPVACGVPTRFPAVTRPASCGGRDATRHLRSHASRGMEWRIFIHRISSQPCRNRDNHGGRAGCPATIAEPGQLTPSEGRLVSAFKRRPPAPPRPF
jgi:hypothetical protein